MRKYQGFEPLKEMIDKGEIKPGRAILVNNIYYEVLLPDPENEKPVYNISNISWDETQDAREFLTNKVWYI